MQRATPHERLAYSVHQLPAGVPAAFLSLGQIIALVEKRLRWYGFTDWRITDVLCDRGPSVAVKIRGREGVVMTIALARDCAAPEYGVHTPEALKRVAPVPRGVSRPLAPSEDDAGARMPPAARPRPGRGHAHA